MNGPAPYLGLFKGPVIQRLPLFVSLLLLTWCPAGPFSVTGISREPRACAFVFHHGGIYNAARAPASSTSLDSLPSFFDRFRRGPKTSEQQPHEESRLKTGVDLYRLLGVPRDASTSAVAARVEELQKLQQEQFSGEDTPELDPLVTSLLHEVSATILNPEQRAAYDEGGYVSEPLYALLQQLVPAQLSSTSQEERMAEEAEPTEDQEEEPETANTTRGPSSLFSALFGPQFLGGNSPFAAFTGRRRSSRPQRGADVESEITLGFVDAALKGASSVPVTVQRQEPCGSCSSSEDRKAGRSSACRECGGRGMQTETRRSSFGFVSTSMSCSACGGTGESGHPPCESCGGEGFVDKEVSIKVNIPAGVSEGSLLRVDGEGSKGTDGGRPGMCVGVVLRYVSVNVEKHNRFSREGADILSEERISLRDAVNGCNLTVETVDGKADIEIPPLSRSGQKVVISGRGAKRSDGPSGKRGDHIITLRVVLPDAITAEDRELLQRLRDAEIEGGK
ncbi:DnaJ domain-containing protein, putative [Eimeria brunetti]|uniref:DnaJ domain-containing protein, putative n=1 Tax=Eimeria brunetti TaxID=51314 RepID=U6LFT7_9EIME|nr:DnaJ domain-containing protein, putative [Eimeria brunetti]